MIKVGECCAASLDYHLIVGMCFLFSDEMRVQKVVFLGKRGWFCYASTSSHNV